MSSKYSALPDIDTQPDVYETPDTCEDAEVSDDGFPTHEEQSEDIVNENITVGDAVDKFKESTGEVTETDAERAIRYKKQLYKQYVKRPPLEYEILPRDPALQETSLQKLRRLMYEVQELGEEVEKKKVIDNLLVRLFLCLFKTHTYHDCDSLRMKLQQINLITMHYHRKY
ncbi:hypothetical protein C2G38_1456033 [Gigaspora rosea]|uniref:Uncharacterized protein n=1 Tax=Gigaspora rosea TaxID=44941 RepID=A0A397V411_9GLOM|nr:hypothetical protein C2G38_1456033 [Gigaspora rosea]